MATYIILFDFTPQGIENIKESPNRVELVRQAFQNMGARVKDFYMVLGQYDTIIIAEAPDDETIAKLSLAISSLGNVLVQTHRAFTEDEYRNIIRTLPQIPKKATRTLKKKR
ncbi:MAG: GYD domain-containing protein [wastewater metagenome]|nr:GYD domain-containing protein [Candidatus Loosdrechtia aerotolerans]